MGAADRAALAIVKAAAPFPKMPAEMSDDQITLNLPLRFAGPATPAKPQAQPPELAKP